MLFGGIVNRKYSVLFDIPIKLKLKFEDKEIFVFDNLENENERKVLVLIVSFEKGKVRFSREKVWLEKVIWSRWGTGMEKLQQSK